MRGLHGDVQRGCSGLGAWPAKGVWQVRGRSTRTRGSWPGNRGAAGGGQPDSRGARSRTMGRRAGVPALGSSRLGFRWGCGSPRWARSARRRDPDGLAPGSVAAPRPPAPPWWRGPEVPQPAPQPALAGPSSPGWAASPSGRARAA